MTQSFVYINRSSHLYKKDSLSVHPSVGPSICSSVTNPEKKTDQVHRTVIIRPHISMRFCHFVYRYFQPFHDQSLCLPICPLFCLSTPAGSEAPPAGSSVGPSQVGSAFLLAGSPPFPAGYKLLPASSKALPAGFQPPPQLAPIPSQGPLAPSNWLQARLGVYFGYNTIQFFLKTISWFYYRGTPQ